MLGEKALKLMVELLELKDHQHYLKDPKPQPCKICKDIPYLDDGLTAHLLDILYPDTAEEPYPFILNIHGGGFIMNSKDKIYENYGMRLATDVFAVVNINYRLSCEEAFPAQIEDVLAVIRFLKQYGAHYQLDMQRMFICGDSAGAYLAAYLCCILHDTTLQAYYHVEELISIRAIALNCGLYDFTSATGKDIGFHLIRPIIERLFADSRYEELPIFPYTSVCRYVNEQFPPAFIMDTEIESFAPEAMRLYERLRAHQVPCKLHIYDKAAQLHHDFQIWESGSESTRFRQALFHFFHEYL